MSCLLGWFFNFLFYFSTLPIAFIFWDCHKFIFQSVYRIFNFCYQNFNLQDLFFILSANTLTCFLDAISFFFWVYPFISSRIYFFHILTYLKLGFVLLLVGCHNFFCLRADRRRKWQHTPVFLPGESQGQRSLVGCRLWGRTELDMTEAS